jgi:uncharacterized protein (TIRG00374 family)
VVSPLFLLSSPKLKNQNQEPKPKMSKPAKTWILRILKIAIAVLGLWMVIWLPWKPEPSITSRDRAKIKAGADYCGIIFKDSVTVWIKEHPDPNLRYIAPTYFTSAPIHVIVDGQDKYLSIDSAELQTALNPDKPRGPVGSRISEWFATFSEVDWRQIEVKNLETLPNSKELAIVAGLKRLIVEANPWFLLLAWALLGIPFLITSWRWMKLMEPQGIKLPYSKCLALTFVGQFYSTLLPGITGGDLVKIIYASKVTGSKTKSTVTVLLDRVIGLLALLVIADVAAILLLCFDSSLTGDSAKTIRNVALLASAFLVGFLIVTALYFSTRVRRFLKIDKLTESTKDRLAARAAARERGETVPEDPAAKNKGGGKLRRRIAEVVVQFDDVLHAYRHHRGVLVNAFLVSLVVQFITPLSAYFVGKAFGMPSPIGYYYAFVPLGLLAASLPLSPPGGIGLTEIIFQHFFAERAVAGLKASASQTFALAQGVRFLPIIWNLIGAYWVVTGTYTRHEAQEESHHDPVVEKSGG